MDHRSKLVALGLVLLAGSASAYVTPSPPAGFGGAPGAWTFTPGSASAQLGSIMRGTGPSIAGAGETTAAYRLGGTAGRVLAGRVIGGLIPAAGLALGVAWLASNCFEKQSGQWVRTCGGGGAPPVVSDGKEYILETLRVGASPVWHKSEASACDAVTSVPVIGGYTVASGLAYGPHSVTAGHGCSIELMYASGGAHFAGPYELQITSRNSDCPAGWYVTPAGCVQTLPPATVTQPEIEAEMETKPLPQTLPPGVPYPLDPTSPSIWNPTIGDPPTTQPMRVPQGIPQAVPNTNPQQYRQPITEWTHSPTATDPWRMDATPKEITSESPTGLTGPTSVTSGAPPAVPSEKPADLCAEHPDIVACQKLGNLEALPVPNQNKNVSITPDSGWDRAASCPPPRTAVFLGKTWTFPWTMFCDFASMIRPLMIGFAWLSAALTFMGLSRKD